MYDRTGNYLMLAILIGMVLGVAVVAIFGVSALPVKVLGDIFLNALMMVVIPLLFCSMVVGITNLGDIRKLGRTGGKTLLYFLATSSIAVVIGLVLVNIFQPGKGFGIVGAVSPEVGSYSLLEWLPSQIPTSIVGAAAQNLVLPIILFALLFGGVLSTMGNKAKPVIAFFDVINDVFMKIIKIFMWYAPIGVFGLVAGQLAAKGGLSEFANVFSALGKYGLVVILGLLIHGIIVLPTILKVWGGKNPIEYFMGMSQALMTALATSSSSATLPVTMECAEDKNDIDKRASSFVLPLGSTINMDGTALYEAVAAIFIAQAYGIDLSIWGQLTIFITAVLASIGAAGIPSAGLVTMVLVLRAVGLPLEGIGMILAIDWILDRFRTTVNVWGDSIGAAVIASTAEIGLVDRTQRRKKAYTDRKDRSKSPSSRDDYRGRRNKGRDYNRKSSSYDRRQSTDRGRKPRNTQTKTNQATPETTDRRDPRTERQSQRRKYTQGNDYKVAAQKEELYTPKSDSGSESKPSDKNRDKSDRQKPVFGRKPQRERGERKDRDADKRQQKTKFTDDTKGSKTSESADDAQIAASGATPGFEIPKFPDKILEELSSSNNELEEYSPDSVEADASSRSIEGLPKLESFDGIALDNVDTNTTEDTGAADARDDSSPFDRMDKLIMGSAETDGSENDDHVVESKTDSADDVSKTPANSSSGYGRRVRKSGNRVARKTSGVESNSEKDDSKSPTSHEDSKPEVTPEEKPVELPSEKVSVSDPVESQEPGEVKNETPSFSDDDEAITVPPVPLGERTRDGEHDEDNSEKDHSPVTSEKQSEESAVSESSNDDTDADESDSEDEEPAMWGRSKRRRPNR